MVTKPWRVERYVMLFLAILYAVFIVIQNRVRQMFYQELTLINLVDILNVLAAFGLIFVHPKDKKIVGILLLVISLYTMITNIISYSNFPFEFFTMGNFVLIVWGFIQQIIKIVVYIIIFFKKSLYSPLDIILPAILLFIYLPTIGFSLFQPNPYSFIGTARYFFIANALGVASGFIFFVILLLYGIGAYHLTKKSNDTLVDSIKKTRTTNIYDALHELENLYGDGILTKDEYESKKKELLMRKG